MGEEFSREDDPRGQQDSPPGPTMETGPRRVRAVVPPGTMRSSPSWRGAVESVIRRLGVATLAGALLGLAVGGIGGRLAMMLLAVRNPNATGLTSDDGFTMGQFTISGTANLLLVTTFIGVLGGGVYLVLRDLMIGPRWFQVCSVSIGPAVVVGAIVVHPDGVDFTLLSPLWLAVSLFVLIPAVYAALLGTLTDRWLARSTHPTRPRRALLTAALLLWVPLAPVLAVGALGWLVAELVRRNTGEDILRSNPLLAWIPRAGLALLFLAALADLGSDIAALT